MKVKVLEVDRQGRVRLSIKEAAEKKEAPTGLLQTAKLRFGSSSSAW